VVCRLKVHPLLLSPNSLVVCSVQIILQVAVASAMRRTEIWVCCKRCVFDTLICECTTQTRLGTPCKRCVYICSISFKLTRTCPYGRGLGYFVNGVFTLQTLSFCEHCVYSFSNNLKWTEKKPAHTDEAWGGLNPPKA
jgi:hypothetical protein